MLDVQIAYYAWAMLLLLGAVTAWTLNVFALPGNWVILGLAALFAWGVTPRADGDGLTWATVGLLAVLAVAGEVVETAAGAFGAARQGGSKRGVALALIGTIAGSIFGAVAGLPVPFAGPVLGALAGGAAGAFLGAYVGEMWKHGFADKSLSVGWGALIGRLLGTAGKLAIGAVMVVSLAVHALT